MGAWKRAVNDMREELHIREAEAADFASAGQGAGLPGHAVQRCGLLQRRRGAVVAATRIRYRRATAARIHSSIHPFLGDVDALVMYKWLAD